VIGAALAASLLARAGRGVPTAIGASRTRLRAAAARSPNAVDGRFANTEPGTLITPGTAVAVARLLLTRNGVGRPPAPVPVVPGAPGGPAGALAATWFGHSSVLLEVDGHRLLADPMWSDRASPSRKVGPRRMHPVPAALDRLPQLDAVLVSHDHYDHLDLATVRALLRRSTAPFLVPAGVAEHLRAWGAPPGRVVELDWGASTQVGALTVVCMEARHFSGRSLARNTTQWASWAVLGPTHRAYFGGDTGYTAAFRLGGEQFGPFDLTLLPIGAYADLWPDIHMTPEEALRAHEDLRGGLLLPVHWATFNLGFHGWAEPVRRLAAAADRSGARIAVPRPGERVDITAVGPLSAWWERLR